MKTLKSRKLLPSVPCQKSRLRRIAVLEEEFYLRKLEKEKASARLQAEAERKSGASEAVAKYSRSKS